MLALLSLSQHGLLKKPNVTEQYYRTGSHTGYMRKRFPKLVREGSLKGTVLLLGHQLELLCHICALVKL